MIALCPRVATGCQRLVRGRAGRPSKRRYARRLLTTSVGNTGRRRGRRGGPVRGQRPSPPGRGGGDEAGMGDVVAARPADALELGGASDASGGLESEDGLLPECDPIGLRGRTAPEDRGGTAELRASDREACAARKRRGPADRRPDRLSPDAAQADFRGAAAAAAVLRSRDSATSHAPTPAGSAARAAGAEGGAFAGIGSVSGPRLARRQRSRNWRRYGRSAPSAAR